MLYKCIKMIGTVINEAAPIVKNTFLAREE